MAKRAAKRVRLTKRYCDAAVYEGNGGSRDVRWDDALSGFGLRVYPTGRKAFVLLYRVPGNPAQSLLSIGAYGALTVDEGRKAARAELSKIETRQGDPLEERRQQQAEAAATGDFGDLLDAYRATLSNPRTAADAKQSLARNIPARLAKKPAREVTSDELADVLKAVHDRGALAVERNLFRFLHAAFEFGLRNRDAIRRFRLTGNPARGIEKPAPGGPGNRELTAEEIRDLWRGLDSAMMAPETATVIRLLLLLGQRVDELLAARWSELDEERGVLDIPPERLKTGRKTQRGHVVPLPPLALDLLRTLPERSLFLFPKRGDPESPMPFRSLSQAIRRFCDDTEGFPRFTPRDIRRSIKTRMAEIGVLKEIRDRVQNHALHDVASKHYDRFDYLADKRAALVGWEWELRRILTDKPTGDDWKRWLRRFVREPDNTLPGRQLARLLGVEEAATVVPLARTA
jgi:integrase